LESKKTRLYIKI